MKKVLSIIILSILLTISLVACESETKSDFITVTAPTKTEYNLGEKIDVTGGKVTVNFSDGKKTDYDLTEDMLSYIKTKTGTVTVTVTLEVNGIQLTDTFTVTFISDGNPNQVLQSISVTAPTKTVYLVGESINTAGGTVTATFSGGNKATYAMTMGMLSYDNTKAGIVNVDVFFMIGSIQKSASFSVIFEEDTYPDALKAEINKNFNAFLDFYNDEFIAGLDEYNEFPSIFGSFMDPEIYYYFSEHWILSKSDCDNEFTRQAFYINSSKSVSQATASLETAKANMAQFLKSFANKIVRDFVKAQDDYDIDPDPGKVETRKYFADKSTQINAIIAKFQAKIDNIKVVSDLFAFDDERGMSWFDNNLIEPGFSGALFLISSSFDDDVYFSEVWSTYFIFTEINDWYNNNIKENILYELHGVLDNFINGVLNDEKFGELLWSNSFSLGYLDSPLDPNSSNKITERNNMINKINALIASISAANSADAAKKLVYDFVNNEENWPIKYKQSLLLDEAFSSYNPNHYWGMNFFNINHLYMNAMNDIKYLVEFSTAEADTAAIIANFIKEADKAEKFNADICTQINALDAEFAKYNQRDYFAAQVMSPPSPGWAVVVYSASMENNWIKLNDFYYTQLAITQATTNVELAKVCVAQFKANASTIRTKNEIISYAFKERKDYLKNLLNDAFNSSALSQYNIQSDYTAASWKMIQDWMDAKLAEIDSATHPSQLYDNFYYEYAFLNQAQVEMALFNMFNSLSILNKIEEAQENLIANMENYLENFQNEMLANLYDNTGEPLTTVTLYSEVNWEIIQAYFFDYRNLVYCIVGESIDHKIANLNAQNYYNRFVYDVYAVETMVETGMTTLQAAYDQILIDNEYSEEGLEALEQAYIAFGKKIYQHRADRSRMYSMYNGALFISANYNGATDWSLGLTDIYSPQLFIVSLETCEFRKVSMNPLEAVPTLVDEKRNELYSKIYNLVGEVKINDYTQVLEFVLGLDFNDYAPDKWAQLDLEFKTLLNRIDLIDSNTTAATLSAIDESIKYFEISIDRLTKLGQVKLVLIVEITRWYNDSETAVYKELLTNIVEMTIATINAQTTVEYAKQAYVYFYNDMRDLYTDPFYAGALREISMFLPF